MKEDKDQNKILREPDSEPLDHDEIEEAHQQDSVIKKLTKTESVLLKWH